MLNRIFDSNKEAVTIFKEEEIWNSATNSYSIKFFKRKRIFFANISIDFSAKFHSKESFRFFSEKTEKIDYRS